VFSVVLPEVIPVLWEPIVLSIEIGCRAALRTEKYFTSGREEIIELEIIIYLFFPSAVVNGFLTEDI